jgi:cytochrome c oxidase subunit 1
MGTAYWLVPKLVKRELELTLLAKVQPYLWFVGMLLFSISNHMTGLMGLPRRIYDPSYLDSPVAESWTALTGVSALGGLFLFMSSAFFLLVMLGTVLAGRRTSDIGLAFAEPLEGAPAKRILFDRLGLWIVAAVVLVLIAYAYPLASHLSMPRFGSPGVRPF